MAGADCQRKETKVHHFLDFVTHLGSPIDHPQTLRSSAVASTNSSWSNSL
jgi:hypothetical protein